jgi:hypothetical protein
MVAARVWNEGLERGFGRGFAVGSGGSRWEQPGLQWLPDLAALFDQIWCLLGLKLRRSAHRCIGGDATMQRGVRRLGVKPRRPKLTRQDQGAKGALVAPLLSNRTLQVGQLPHLPPGAKPHGFQSVSIACPSLSGAPASDSDDWVMFPETFAV